MESCLQWIRSLVNARLENTPPFLLSWNKVRHSSDKLEPMSLGKGTSPNGHKLTEWLKAIHQAMGADNFHPINWDAAHFCHSIITAAGPGVSIYGHQSPDISFPPQISPSLPPAITHNSAPWRLGVNQTQHPLVEGWPQQQLQMLSWATVKSLGWSPHSQTSLRGTEAELFSVAALETFGENFCFEKWLNGLANAESETLLSVIGGTVVEHFKVTRTFCSPTADILFHWSKDLEDEINFEPNFAFQENAIIAGQQRWCYRKVLGLRIGAFRDYPQLMKKFRKDYINIKRLRSERTFRRNLLLNATLQW